MKKVIHAPLEIAGQVGLICEFLRRQGYYAVGYNYWETFLDYQKVVNTDCFELIKILEHAIPFYDIFHFHNGCTFSDNFEDLEMIRKAGKKIVMHHRGTDVRSRQFARKGQDYENPYVYAEGSLPDEIIFKNLECFSQVVDAVIVQDHELYKYVAEYYHKEGKKVYILPRLFDTSTIPAPNINQTDLKEPPLIVHAPTNPETKGTKIIEDVLESLKLERKFTYKRIEQMDQKTAMEWYSKADIIIDQILCGAYGNLTVEGMAMGKPVVCYIRPDLGPLYPKDLPIVSANPDTLREKIIYLLDNQDQWLELGFQGRKYVENYHEASKVIQKLISIYQSL